MFSVSRGRSNVGYYTSFSGVFRTDKPMDIDHRLYLKAFSEKRRMWRDALQTAKRPDLLREKVGLPVGIQGGYFVGSPDVCGQENSPDVVESNSPPAGQPGLWCPWTPDDEDPCVVRWDESEKPYDYVEWLEYMIQHFLSPWGYVLNGTVVWDGEEQGDTGAIVVKDNAVTTVEPKKPVLPKPTR